MTLEQWTAREKGNCFNLGPDTAGGIIETRAREDPSPQQNAGVCLYRSEDMLSPVEHEWRQQLGLNPGVERARKDCRSSDDKVFF